MDGFVSRQCIQHIGNELERIKFVGCDKTTCGCFIETTCGCFIKTTYALPYVCEVTGYQILGKPITLDSIHVFCKKIFIEEHEVTKEDRETQLDLEEECEELKKYFYTLDIVGQRVMKKKVRELTHTSTTSMCPPPVKY